MLKIDKTNQNASSMSMLPWLDLATPDLMLCKDGSLLASFDFECLDPDNVDDEKIDAVTTQLHRAFNLLTPRFMAWITVTKIKDKTYGSSTFANSVAQALDNTIAEHFQAGNMFVITHRLHVLYTGVTGVHNYMDSVQRLINEENKSVPMALLLAANPASANANAALHDKVQLEQNILEFEMALVNFVGSLHDFKFKRLSQWALESALLSEANITLPPGTIAKKPIGVLFDGWASQSEVEFGRSVVKVSGAHGVKYAAQLSIKEYPPQLHSLMLENILVSGGEVKITHVIKFLDQDAAKKEIDAGIEYYKMTQFSLMSRAMSKLTGSDPVPRPGKQDLLLECMEAKRRQTAENLGFVLHAMTVSVYGDSAAACEAAVNKTLQKFSSSGFSTIRERMNIGGSFISMLPGQWSKQLRLNLQNSEAVSDCLPVYTVIDEGESHPYFSEDVFHKPVPQLATFQNVYGSRSYFNSHVKQVGHMVIIAPSGGGKTTFVNFCLSQFQRYEKTNTIIFDRDYSCKITTLLHGGTHIDLKSGHMKLNPLFALRDGTPDGPVWVREFILRRLEEGGYASTATDRLLLDGALKNLSESTQDLSLSILATQLPKHLSLELGEWLEGRPFGMFDCVHDDFELSDWTCIEMKEIMSVERVARAFLDYAFRRISTALDGTPTFIYLEEASFLLNHPAFGAVIDDWLKTLRKKNAFLWMTIQSPTSVTNNSISSSLLDNIKTIMVLANKKVESHRESYKSNFGMTDDQITRIGSLVPQRDYMVIKDGFCRVIRTIFNRKSLGYLRSEVTLQAKFEAAKASGRDDWKELYLKQV